MGRKRSRKNKKVRKSIESRKESQESPKQIHANNIDTQVLEKFGIIMSTAYLVVKCILSNLSCPELDQCAWVCILWKKVSEDILSKRRKVVFLFLRYDYCIGYDLATGHSRYSPSFDRPSGLNCEIISPSEVGFVMDLCDFDVRVVECEGCERKTNLCCSHNLLTKDETKFWDSLSECTIYSLLTDIHKLPVTWINFYRRTAIIIPYVPGIKIHSFNFPCAGVIIKNLAYNDFLKMANIPSEEDIKCLLLFFDDFRGTKRILSWLSGQNKKMAVAGATLNCKSGSKQCMGIAFSGKRVRASSLILENDDKDFIQEKFKKLKESNIFNICLAFVFGNRDMSPPYEEVSLASCIFKEMFPEIPLFAFYSYSHFALNYIPGQMEEVNCNRITILNHSTAFLLISLGTNTV
ncbi:uncharacterized protein [Centruroides vittatus]|uniref:uncharacterized protein isoform X1 n=2 Tax=Centruroides vittatus TaxID=120091 RepID=UPI00350F9071